MKKETEPNYKEAPVKARVMQMFKQNWRQAKGQVYYERGVVRLYYIDVVYIMRKMVPKDRSKEIISLELSTVKNGHEITRTINKYPGRKELKKYAAEFNNEVTSL